MDKMMLHPQDTAHAAYARAMRFGAFAMAAVIASDHGLGRDLTILALDLAMCRFEKLGFPEAAVALAERLGFTVVTVGLDQLARVASPELSPATERPRPLDPSFLN